MNTERICLTHLRQESPQQLSEVCEKIATHIGRLFVIVEEGYLSSNISLDCDPQPERPVI